MRKSPFVAGLDVVQGSLGTPSLVDRVATTTEQNAEGVAYRCNSSAPPERQL